MNFENVEIDEINKAKKALADFYNGIEEMNKSLRMDTFKLSLLNIDSANRNKVPKNITEVNRKYLDNNPITLKKGSKQLKFYLPNHGFSIGDNITITNVQSNTKTLSNSIYFIDGLSYMIIKFKDHNIDKNYTNYVNQLNIESEILSKINSTNDKKTRFYGNIPINMTIGLLKILTFNDLIENQLINNIQVKLIIDNFDEIGNEEDIYRNFIFIKIEFPFNISTLDTEDSFINSNIIGSSIFTIPYVYKISFMNLEGIPLYYINADYPIIYQRQQGNQEIDNVEQDYFYINCKSVSYSNGNYGGDKITVSKILRTISGYPNASEFSIDLKKTFNNVSRIEMVSSEIPFIEYTVTAGLNNKFYWQNFDDGDTIYSISVPSGTYNASNLISKLSAEINLVERINSTEEELVYNIFDLEANIFTSEIVFRSFSVNSLPNSITNDTVTIDTKVYYRLTIKHPNNFVEVKDEIEIINSNGIGVIPKASINGFHTIYEVDKLRQTYSIILAPFNENPNPPDPPGNGGLSLTIKTPTKFRLLLNRSDSIGSLLGFRRVGEENSITNYTSKLSNFDSYSYQLNVDTVGNYYNFNNLFQIDGTTTYWLLYINDYENVILDGIDNAFSKILITAVQGEMCFNSFVNNPVTFDVPIPSLSELNIRVTDKYGNNVNFLNYNFSFTLRIYENVSKPKDTELTRTNYYDELIKNTSKKSMINEN